jgi:hypothetical protein
MLYVQDSHPVVKEIQSKGWRLSVRTKLAVIGSLHPLLCMYIACCTALFMQHVCVCVLFIRVNFCCWSGVGSTCWICTRSFLFYFLGMYLNCDFKMCSAQIYLCLLFILSPVCSVSPTELPSTFVCHIFATDAAFQCYFCAGFKLKWSVCVGPYSTCGSAAGDFMWHFIKYVNFSHFFFSLPSSLTVMTSCSLLVVFKM